MATRHVCDVCGSEVGERHELWEVSFAPTQKMRGIPDKRRYERFEVCNRCKRRAYVALMEREEPKE